MLYMYRLVRYMYISFDVYDCGKCTNTAALEIAYIGFFGIKQPKTSRRSFYIGFFGIKQPPHQNESFFNHKSDCEGPESSKIPKMHTL